MQLKLSGAVTFSHERGLTCRRCGWSARGMASARGTSKGFGGMQPKKVMESERRKKGWFWPVSAGTGSSSLSCKVEPGEGGQDLIARGHRTLIRAKQKTDFIESRLSRVKSFIFNQSQRASLATFYDTVRTLSSQRARKNSLNHQTTKGGWLV